MIIQAFISISISFIIYNNTITCSDLFIDTFISQLHKYNYTLDAQVSEQPFLCRSLQHK